MTVLLVLALLEPSELRSKPGEGPTAVMSQFWFKPRARGEKWFEHERMNRGFNNRRDRKKMTSSLS